MNILKLSTVVLLLFLFGCGRSQSSIEQIEDYKNKINKDLKSCDSLSKNVYDLSSEGAVFKFYFKDADTLLKKQIYYGETGKRIITFYLKNDKPVYIDSKDYFYDKPIYEDNGNIKIDRAEKKEYYLDDEMNILKWKLNDEFQSPETIATEQNLLKKEYF